MYRRLALACFVVPCIAISTIVANITPANALGPRPHCKVCRRFTDTSPASMATSYRFGRRVVSYQMCSMFCYLEFIEDFTEHEPENIRVLNFNSIDTEMRLSLNADRAWFLHGVEGNEQKVHEPYSVAFGTEREATAAQEELGGEIMRFGELAEIVKELTDEWEPEKHGPRYEPDRRIPR